GNLNNRHVEILCAASAHVNVSVSYQPLTPPTGLGLLACSRRAPFGRIAWGSVAPRKMACRLAREGKRIVSGSRPSTRAQGRGSLLPALFKGGGGMAHNPRVFVCPGPLPLFRTVFAWVVYPVVFGSFFSARGVTAVLGITQRHWR